MFLFNSPLISLLIIDLIELDTLVALFHPGDVVFEINPVHLLSNYSVPVDINFVVLIIKPFVSTILTLGDISETKVIFKGAFIYVCSLLYYVINTFSL